MKINDRSPRTACHTGLFEGACENHNFGVGFRGRPEAVSRDAPHPARVFPEVGSGKMGRSTNEAGMSMKTKVRTEDLACEAGPTQGRPARPATLWPGSSHSQRRPPGSLAGIVNRNPCGSRGQPRGLPRHPSHSCPEWAAARRQTQNKARMSMKTKDRAGTTPEGTASPPQDEEWRGFPALPFLRHTGAARQDLTALLIPWYSGVLYETS